MSYSCSDPSDRPTRTCWWRDSDKGVDVSSRLGWKEDPLESRKSFPVCSVDRVTFYLQVADSRGKVGRVVVSLAGVFPRVYSFSRENKISE